MAKITGELLSGVDNGSRLNDESFGKAAVAATSPINNLRRNGCSILKAKTLFRRKHAACGTLGTALSVNRVRTAASSATAFSV